MNPIYKAISWIMLRWHDLWDLILPDGRFLGTNWDWVLAIVFLVITVRVVLFPIFVKQIRSQRAMQAIQPKMKQLQEKYKGDPQTFKQEMVKLYQTEKVNPLMGCLPMFIQIPVFFGLFTVLRNLSPGKTPQWGWSQTALDSATKARLFGAPIPANFSASAAELEALNHASGTAVKVVAGVLVLTMMLTTFMTSRQMILKTGWQQEGQQRMLQKLMLYGIPFSLLLSGWYFPLGVVIYWVVQNLASLGQQYWVLHKYPPPATVTAATRSATVTRKSAIARFFAAEPVRVPPALAARAGVAPTPSLLDRILRRKPTPAAPAAAGPSPLAPRPGAKPITGARPVAGAKPATGAKPAPAKPVGAKPVGAKPVGAKPVAAKPVTGGRPPTPAAAPGAKSSPPPKATPARTAAAAASGVTTTRPSPSAPRPASPVGATIRGLTPIKATPKSRPPADTPATVPSGTAPAVPSGTAASSATPGDGAAASVTKSSAVPASPRAGSASPRAGSAHRGLDWRPEAEPAVVAGNGAAASSSGRKPKAGARPDGKAPSGAEPTAGAKPPAAEPEVGRATGSPKPAPSGAGQRAGGGQKPADQRAGGGGQRAGNRRTGGQRKTAARKGGGKKGGSRR